MTRGAAPDVLEFVRREGIVLQAARGPVPSLAELVAGERIRGSWWGHPSGQAIFRAAERVTTSGEVLVCRLVVGKVTYVHRRLWPALARLADRFPAEALAQVSDEHTASGHHRRREEPFLQWLPPDVAAAAARLSETEAEHELARWPWLLGEGRDKKPDGRRRSRR